MKHEAKKIFLRGDTENNMLLYYTWYKQNLTVNDSSTGNRHADEPDKQQKG